MQSSTYLPPSNINGMTFSHYQTLYLHVQQRLLERAFPLLSIDLQATTLPA